MRQPGIYVLENTTTGKQYVGQSVDVNQRRQQHFNSMQKGKHHNPHIQQDYNRGHNFSFGVIEYCDLSSLNQREKYWINRLNTYQNGYNLTSGGGKTFVYVDQTPQKSWREIHENRSKRELENYHRRIKRLKKWTQPEILLIMIVLAIIGRIFAPLGLILFYGIIFIYFIQLLALYSAKKDYNRAVNGLKSYGVNKSELGSVTIHFFKLIIENIKKSDFKEIISENKTLLTKYLANSKINDILPIDNYVTDLKEPSDSEKKEDYSILKLKICPSCKHSLTKVSKKCPHCGHTFEE